MPFFENMTFCRTASVSLIALCCLAGGEARAAGPAAAGGLRELTTDRPDSTESPFTVDPGHVQLEMDAVSYMRNRLDGVKTTEWALAPLNLRVGVGRSTELGVFVTPHMRVTEEPRGGPKTTARGIGDTTLRAKLNFWGNDGGPTAAGMFLDLKLPTAADGLGNDKVEGAATFPVAYEIGAGWEGAAMTAVGARYTEAGRRRAVWINTITFARDLAPDVGGFLELTSEAGDGPHVATFNCGVTRRLTPQFQLDAGVNLGITRTAPDLAVFAGLSRKF